MDLKANIFKIINKLYWTISSSFISRILVFFNTLKGVNFGSRNIFFGIPTFKRAPNSRIIIGDNCKFRSKSNSNYIGINRPCILSTHLPISKLVIGHNCGFSGTVIGVFSSITLGNSVRCGANTLITDSDWHLDDPRSSKPRPIIINDNVWLGVNVVVMKGVSIGENSVIGANSVVTKDVPSNVIAAGNPCKVIKKISYE